MSEFDSIWSDPRLVHAVAAAAVALLVVTVWLFRRRRRTGRHAAMVCLLVSVALHVALVVLVPLLPPLAGRGGSPGPPAEEEELIGAGAIDFHAFDPDRPPEAAKTPEEAAGPGPLPLSELAELPEADGGDEATDVADGGDADAESASPDPQPPADTLPTSLASAPAGGGDQTLSQLDSTLGEWLDTALAEPERAAGDAPEQPKPAEKPNGDPEVAATDPAAAEPPAGEPPVPDAVAPADAPAAKAEADPGQLADRGESPQGGESSERAESSRAAEPRETGPPKTGPPNRAFTQRRGEAKQRALEQTGGDRRTEAAVAAALRFLARAQGDDGAWDPSASGAGQERAPLGETRGGAGARAESAITGLALLAMMGAGNTHRQGEYSENVYRGLAYLIRHQKPDGSLAGDASVYAATYSHGMAALAMAEAAAITGDASAIEAAKRAVRYTEHIQHPTTGGFRYTRGDPGDLSQLGWQAMALEAAQRAGIRPKPQAVRGVQRFLRSVRAGAHGGLARYRPGEASSRTMTAEALATRLLIGETVPPEEIAEAERSMLERPPGVGQDNYYYWYYATLALHQLQDDAWRRWNKAMQRRLLETQHPSGSWPATTVWGGYGGTVYTTAMATLCLEAYYRHGVRHRRGRVAADHDGQTNR